MDWKFEFTSKIIQLGKNREPTLLHNALISDLPLIHVLPLSGSRLIKCFCRLIEIDDFMANLWKVHLAVKQEGYAHVRITSLYSCAHGADNDKVS